MVLALGLAPAQELAQEMVQALAQEQALVQELVQELGLAPAQELGLAPAQELVQVPVQEQEMVQALAQALVLALARSPHRSKMGQALPCCRDWLQSNRRVLDSIRGRATPYSSRCLGLDPAQTGTLAHSSRLTLALRPFRSRAHPRARV
jgi:hypothetical protein